MFTNLLVFASLLIVVAFIINWLRSGNTDTTATNSLIKHRLKRVVSEGSHESMPDASRAHAHERKVEVEETPEVAAKFFKFTLIKSISDAHEFHVLSTDQNMRKPHPLLNALTSNITDAKTLYDIVKVDPELVAKIINVSNSPLFGLSKPIVNVHHAIVYLGIVQVKNIATHFALQKSLTFKDNKQQQAYQKIWAASFLASSIVTVIANEMQIDNAAELSTRCQLSYLGDISLLFSSPETTKLYLGKHSFLDRIDFIQKLTEVNTAILGGILAKKWNLPANISNTLHNSTLPFTNEFPTTSLSELEIQQTLLCYCSCRLAEAVIFEGSSDIINAKSLSFASTGKEDFYHMPEQLETYNLTKLSTVFGNSSVKVKLIEAARLTAQKM